MYGGIFTVFHIIPIYYDTLIILAHYPLQKRHLPNQLGAYM